MAIWYCLRWWYGEGWQWVFRRMVVDRVVDTTEVFSMKDLFRTWFAPYRQTFSGVVQGSLGAKMRGAIDNLISRIIGFFVRTCLLVAGIFMSVFVFLVGIFTLALWAFIPLLPVISLVLFATGWTV